MKIRDRLKIIGQALTNNVDLPKVGRTVENKKKIFDLLGGIVDLSPTKLSSDKTVSTKILNANKGWVYRNNDAIAQEVSKLEFELYSMGIQNGEIVYNPVDSHPLLTLLDKPNPETTKNDALYIIQSHKKLTGNAYWVKIRNGKQVVGLRTLPPDKVTLDLENPTADSPSAVRAYIYQDTINGKSVKVTYEPENIIHFKKPDPNKMFVGVGAVEALDTTIDLDNLTEQVLMQYLKNGAIHNFALTTPNKINDDQLKRLKAELRSSLQGTKNAFNVPIFGGDLKPTDISYSNKEQQLLDQLEWYRDKIMYGFGNTKASLGMIDDVNRASHEGSIIEWQRNTIKPDMQSIVNTLNEFLVPEFGQNLVLGFCDPVPEDRSDDIVEAKDLYTSRIITLNEARETVGYEEVDEGDKFLAQNAPVTQDTNPTSEGQNDE
jgi:HK97 family phage portal protein